MNHDIPVSVSHPAHPPLPRAACLFLPDVLQEQLLLCVSAKFFITGHHGSLPFLVLGIVGEFLSNALSGPINFGAVV